MSDFYLTVNGNHQWSPDDVAVEEDEEESGELGAPGLRVWGLGFRV